MALQDNTVSYLNASLSANLSWLTNAFGVVNKRVKKKDGKEYTFPGLGNTKEYDNLLPDTKLGNYSYFDIEDGSDYEIIGSMIRTPFKCKIVFWWYWPDLYNDWEDRSIEDVKLQILNVLKATNPTNVVKVFKIYEDADNIYKGYYHQEVDRQFLMRPYGGIAIECEVYPMQVCEDEVVIPILPSIPYGSIPFTHSYVAQKWPYEKWIGGASIYCISYYWATGSDDLKATVIPDSAFIFQCIKTSSVGTSDLNSGAELIKEGGIYKMFASAQEVNIYLTIKYVPA